VQSRPAAHHFFTADWVRVVAMVTSTLRPQSAARRSVVTEAGGNGASDGGGREIDRSRPEIDVNGPGRRRAARSYGTPTGRGRTGGEQDRTQTRLDVTPRSARAHCEFSAVGVTLSLTDCRCCGSSFQTPLVVPSCEFIHRCPHL